MSNLVSRLPGAGAANKILTGCLVAGAVGFGTAAYHSNTTAEKIMYGTLAGTTAMLAIVPIVMDLIDSYKADRKSQQQ